MLIKILLKVNFYSLDQFYITYYLLSYYIFEVHIQHYLHKLSYYNQYVHNLYLFQNFPKI